MGRLPHSALEVRLAATLFLLLLGVADLFGAWEVANFSAFTPAGVAATVVPPGQHSLAAGGSMAGMDGMESMSAPSTAHEEPVDLAALNRPKHTISRDLLVQDTHVHIPSYALTAAALSLIAFGLALTSRARVAIVLLAFAAPFADFAGLWGAHLMPSAGAFFGGLAVVGGFAMGLAYLVVCLITLFQCWLRKPAEDLRHAR
jgi:hypothetical protein